MQTTDSVASLAEARLVKGSDAWIESHRERVRVSECRWLNRSLGLPLRYTKKPLANFEGAAQIKKQALTGLANTNVFLWGPCGTGKTHLALGLLRDRFAALMSYTPEKLFDPKTWHSEAPDGWDVPRARFVSCQALVCAMKDRISNDGSAVALIDELLDLDLVLIDDFGASRLTEYVTEMLSM